MLRIELDDVVEINQRLVVARGKNIHQGAQEQKLDALRTQLACACKINQCLFIVLGEDFGYPTPCISPCHLGIKLYYIIQIGERIGIALGEEVCPSTESQRQTILRIEFD